MHAQRRKTKYGEAEKKEKQYEVILCGKINYHEGMGEETNGYTSVQGLKHKPRNGQISGVSKTRRLEGGKELMMKLFSFLANKKTC